MLFDAGHRGPAHLWLGGRGQSSDRVRMSCGTSDAAEMLTYRKAGTPAGWGRGSKVPAMHREKDAEARLLSPLPHQEHTPQGPAHILCKSQLPGPIQAALPLTLPATLSHGQPAPRAALHGAELLPWEDTGHAARGDAWPRLPRVTELPGPLGRPGLKSRRGSSASFSLSQGPAQRSPHLFPK